MDLFPAMNFHEHELKKFKAGDEIEVILDELESTEGNVILSYEKAKAMQAWDEITKLFEEEKPAEGMVTHKVKGGLSVDIGIPAFLPGSQIDFNVLLILINMLVKPSLQTLLKLIKNAETLLFHAVNIFRSTRRIS